jgi:hypothetical protein
MPAEGRPMKAYRPSRYGSPDIANEEAEVIRLANLEMYTRRASQGLPIFEEKQSARNRQRVVQM